MRDDDIGPRTASGRDPDISAGRRRGAPTTPAQALGAAGGPFPGDPEIPVDETGIDDPGADADLATDPATADRQGDERSSPATRSRERQLQRARRTQAAGGPAARGTTALPARGRRTRPPWAWALVAILVSFAVIAAIVLFAVTGLVAGLIVLLAGGVLATAVALVVGVLRFADLDET